ncbi:E3 ubiquitin-protein ligase RNF181-like [Tigriopus californicus]|uniref:E3 ubiquitin-protein ligase RNF181-like n=1 Tax=Tigriopus californicus TaxID=6832 RepID=UPI0027DA2EA2|nr:E3 ubiquitin-protein ligase RNF181-like [Tigriopus californicus]
MASYFDEHDCEPLRQGEAPNHFMDFARLLVDTGAWREDEFAAIFSDRPPPPTSKKFLEEDMEEKMIRNECDEFECPICLKKCEQDDLINVLPCKHKFHPECILPWLKKTSSCPLCRFELPTDDPNYEEMKKQRKRDINKKKDIEALHDSMFG